MLLVYLWAGMFTNGLMVGDFSSQSYTCRFRNKSKGGG